MVQTLTDLRSQMYLKVLGWLGDGRLRHCDVARNQAGEVVAITFARDLGYIEQVREIDSNGEVPVRETQRERTLGRRVRILSVALTILTAGIVLEELTERLTS
jgi:hypothetical protein